MNERDRLIELLDSGCYEAISKCKGEDSNKKLCEFLADKLLENGAIVPLINVGDTVFIKGEAVEVEFLQIEKEINYFASVDCEARDCGDCPFYEDDISWEGEHDCKTYGCLEFTAKDIGRTVFLDRESYEKALEERSGNNEV